MVQEEKTLFCNFLGQGGAEEDGLLPTVEGEAPALDGAPAEPSRPRRRSRRPDRYGNPISRFLRRRRYFVYPYLQVRLLLDTVTTMRFMYP